MTALELIDSIFTRTGRRRKDPNQRGISREQLNYLRRLIVAEPAGERLRAGSRGSLVWKAAGLWSYVLTEDPAGGEEHTLLRSRNVDPNATGSLFG